MEFDGISKRKYVLGYEPNSFLKQQRILYSVFNILNSINVILSLSVSVFNFFSLLVRNDLSNGIATHTQHTITPKKIEMMRINTRYGYPIKDDENG